MHGEVCSPVLRMANAPDISGEGSSTHSRFMTMTRSGIGRGYFFSSCGVQKVARWAVAARTAFTSSGFTAGALWPKLLRT